MDSLRVKILLIDLRINFKKYRMYQKLLTTLLLLITVTILSCNSSTKQPDVSAIKLPLTFNYFNKDFAKIDTNLITNSLKELKNKYPTFFDFYLDTLAGFNVHGDYQKGIENVHTFLTFKDYVNLNDTVNLVYKDMESTDKEIENTLKLIKHYDATFPIPTNIYYFVSGLNQWTAVTHFEDELAIGLDMFLGADFAPYQSVGIPQYVLLQFDRKMIPIWAAKAVYTDRFAFNNQNKDLLDMMIQKGKMQYFLSKVCPNVPLYQQFGFTEAQYKWCEENQALIYNFFVQGNMLYEKNQQKIMRYILDGPTAAGLPPESPANVGSYIGLKIVESYCNKKDVSLESLLKTTESLQIFKEANYKP